VNDGSAQSGRLVVAATPENQKVNLEKVLGVQCLDCGESIPPDKRRFVELEHVECPRLGAGSLMIGLPDNDRFDKHHHLRKPILPDRQLAKVCSFEQTAVDESSENFGKSDGWT
jgi:hypothetical protein